MVRPTADGRARVVILAGPSGAGKSRLAGRLHAAHGWPIVRLDDFYREQSDPALPRHPELGIVDWDDPASWNADEALTALVTLIDTGRADMPVYDLMKSATIGTREVTVAAGQLVLAEGIFAAEIIGRLRAEGILHSAWCIHQGPTTTFVRRLVRDLAERRKPPLVLIRRGWGLRRAEPVVVARQVRLGATAASPADVEELLSGEGQSGRLG